MKKVIYGFIIAAVFWFIMFSPWTKDSVNFWYIMVPAAIVLIVYSLIAGERDLREVFFFKPSYILFGLLSAAVLYAVFYTGDIISGLLFDFSRHQIENIYVIKEQANKLLIAFSLLFIVGPAEEIFWRGFAQHRLMQKYGDVQGLLLATALYTLVHIWSFNFILIMAALICGLFWGLMYMRNKSLVPVIISHAIWDVSIFILFPISA
jgi:membrane protease YdiL (CAAX protease family)